MGGGAGVGRGGRRGYVCMQVREGFILRARACMCVFVCGCVFSKEGKGKTTEEKEADRESLSSRVVDKHKAVLFCFRSFCLCTSHTCTRNLMAKDMQYENRKVLSTSLVRKYRGMPISHQGFLGRKRLRQEEREKERRWIWGGGGGGREKLGKRQ